ncbi:MAG: hypothetical protein Q7J60_22860, partial [Bradyrhizobium sp.]|nr:hypothetical protein [Bradyrhizobium sp.]
RRCLSQPLAWWRNIDSGVTLSRSAPLLGPFLWRRGVFRPFGGILGLLPFPVVFFKSLTEHNGVMMVVSSRRPQAYADD